MSFLGEVSVGYKGGSSKCGLPQRDISEKLWEEVLPAFGLRYSKDMLDILTCRFPSYEGDDVLIKIAAPTLSCQGLWLARRIVSLAKEITPDRQFICEVMCLEGKFRVTSAEMALQGA